MKTFKVEVHTLVEVTLDETKFDEEFFADFNSSISDWGDDLEEHAKHIAWLASSDRLDDFTEGYGPIKEMGIKASIVNTDTEVI